MKTYTYVWQNPASGEWLLIIRRGYEEGLTIYQHLCTEDIARSLMRDGVPLYGNDARTPTGRGT